MAPAKAPRLVRRPAPARPRPQWDEAGRRVLSGTDGFVRVLGGPGTGKTTLLAEVAADRIRNGAVDPEQLLVLTASRRAAADLRARITALLTASEAPAEVPRTVREPMVRTVHSYAFAVLRLRSVLHDLPRPRLLSGPEQDAMIRELLAGDLDDGAPNWPGPLRGALGLPGFAEELRDLMLRAAERGLGPEDLITLGRRHKRAEWVAAGRFAQQYEQVVLLHGAADSATAQASAPALDAAELVAGALLAFDTDAELLAAERDRVRYLLVDDAQHLDPVQFRLIRSLGRSAKEFVLAGDPNQAVFSFRGADPLLLDGADNIDGAGTTVVLGTEYRMAPAIAAAVDRLAARLPGHAPRRRAAVPGADTGDPGRVEIRLHATAAAEANWVADQLRRARLIEGVPWSEMAVLVRSATRSIPVLHRALAAAGVPVVTGGDELPLAEQPAVRPLLTLLRCAAQPDALTTERAALLLSSLGGADPLALRRLRRGLRRLELAAGGERPSDELIVEILAGGDRLTALSDAEAAPVRRVAGLLDLARRAVRDGASVEQVLWNVWRESGLEQRLVAQAARGGTVGAQADRDLDSIVGLFHAAERFADRLPGSGVAGFADHLAAQRIAGDSLAPSAPSGDAVAVLTAHAAAGREWTVVAVPGVQEGSWPDLRLRGSLLGVERLVDLLSGVDPSEHVSVTAPLLAEERRLLLVAASRARRRLFVSAIRGEDEQPSRFLAELAGLDAAEAAAAPVAVPQRALALADLVGELRRAACDSAAPAERRRLAARQLARLAAVGVPGADPDGWYGLPELSSSIPLRDRDTAVAVTPSTVEQLIRCPLRWMVEKHGGADPVELPAVTGILVHALAEAAASGADEAGLRAELDRAWDAVDAGAPWFSRRERARVHAMMDTFLTWLRTSRDELTQVAVEQEVTIDLPAPPDGPRVRLRGRIDRLESDANGRPVVVDIKTGKVPISEADAKEHPQLALYQLAAAHGAFSRLGLDAQPGGARLLYVAKRHRSTGAAERSQDPLDDPTRWLETVHTAARSSTGPDYQARQTPDCDRCPVRTSCPLHSSGRQVP